MLLRCHSRQMRLQVAGVVVNGKWIKQSNILNIISYNVNGHIKSCLIWMIFKDLRAVLWGMMLQYVIHYDDVIMSAIASQITSLTIVYSTVYSGADQRKHQSSASLAFVCGIHRDRWISRTEGQLRGNCFHLMTSSCWLWVDRNPHTSHVIDYIPSLECKLCRVVCYQVPLLLRG